MSVEEKTMLHIMNCNTSKEMWGKLVSIYEQTSGTCVYMLLQQWYSLQKKATDDIVTHIARIEDLAHCLQILGEQIPEQMVVTKILMTLPVVYKYFVSAWESVQASERTLSNLISRLTTEENRINVSDQGESAAYAANNSSQKSGKNTTILENQAPVTIVMSQDAGSMTAKN
ncbi:uncharacterized protein LOC126481801 [Schistocerca serialis cubense]|uniref:uncharacterized protein LOC126481801 n=1 Tax=Schistocerca serialis cubense TaxID=2023355 RepID=UPI00214F5831|nr:uncharacterized protein LOC126481801 [Schistocerca serialis cubense]